MSEKIKKPSNDIFPQAYTLPENPVEYLKQLHATIQEEFPDHFRAFKADIDLLDQFSQDESRGSTELCMRIPKNRQDESGDTLTVLGEVPLETVGIMGGIYALTGAEVVKDEVRDSAPFYRKILRKGEYKGKTVYFQEEIFDHGPQGSMFPDRSSLRWSLHSEIVIDPTGYSTRRNPLAQLGLDMYERYQKKDN
jgi:hypothetical protein